ncbi:MAG: S-ribosylhomocysteine lyase [Clostridia bacterium]|nr:S-ribosylhomocysteine lyase [Clostridia bacterium]
MRDVKRITSFTVDHDKIDSGIYVSRIDGDIVTYDMRTRRPNGGDYMDNLTMHTFEHMFATYVRNSDIADSIIYFGPMGCRTGFYLLVRGKDNETVLKTVIETLEKIIEHKGAVFGAARRECGNYRGLRLSSAKEEAKRYLSVLKSRKNTFEYEG